MLRFGWGGREKAFAAMHKEYGPVYCLWQPFPCPPLVVTSFAIPEADVFDSVRMERFLITDSIMSLKGDAYYRAKLKALQKLKVGSHWSRFERVVSKWAPRLSEGLIGDDAVAEHDSIANVDQHSLDIWTLQFMADWLFDLEVDETEAQEFVAHSENMAVEVTKRTHQPRWMWYLDWQRYEEYRAHLGGLHLLCRKWETQSTFLVNLQAELPELTHDELLFTLIAGYSTTALALRSSLASLADLSRDDPTPAVLETLKAKPTVPFSSKIVSRDLIVAGTLIPRGCRLMRLKTLASDASPFGAGFRRCYGQRFAEHALQCAVEQARKDLLFSPTHHSTPTPSRSLSRSSRDAADSDHAVHLLDTRQVHVSPSPTLKRRILRRSRANSSSEISVPSVQIDEDV